MYARRVIAEVVFGWGLGMLTACAVYTVAEIYQHRFWGRR
jgi:hypothetical protein